MTMFSVSSASLSILSAPGRRLTLAQIYKWISDTYPFYNTSDIGWQNSIRHSLSVNEAFIKQERPKDDPGKGSYWTIQPSMEDRIRKYKARRKPRPKQNASTNLLPVTQPVPSYSLPQSTGAVLQSAMPDMFSDATFLASDCPLPEEHIGERASRPLTPSSSPTAIIRSSPPVGCHSPSTEATSRAGRRFRSTPRNISHQGEFASLHDSGYSSSLGLSQKQSCRLLTLEAGRPKISRDRAEEEIAWLRGSSYDGPSKNRSTVTGFDPTSSPLHQTPTLGSQISSPLTPTMKLKAPVKPPPPISPNTSLRRHREKVREMVSFPVPDMTFLDENLPPRSPTSNFDDAAFIFTNDHEAWHLFLA